MHATTVAKAELRQQVLAALTTKPGSAERRAGLTVVADTLGLSTEDRASLGLTASSSSSAAASGASYGRSPAAGGESAGFGLLGEGQSPAAAAAGAAGPYGHGGSGTGATPRADAGSRAAGGRRSVLGRVVGVLFGRGGGGDKPAGARAVTLLQGCSRRDHASVEACRHVV